eukprot:3421059-Alexandrium_andersonii.AAC.1
MEFCLGSSVELALLMALVVLGAFALLRTVLWASGRIGLVMPRWAMNQPLFEERPAISGFSKDFTMYCAWYGASTTLIHN